MMVFVLKGLDEDLFTFFHEVSTLIIDIISWHSSSYFMDLFRMRELCFPYARLLKFMYLFSLYVSLP
jgi:hypothetical protein